MTWPLSEMWEEPGRDGRPIRRDAAQRENKDEGGQGSLKRKNL